MTNLSRLQLQQRKQIKALQSSLETKIAASGSSTDLTPVYAAISGKANTVHTHALSSLTQSGATTNQVPQWNGTAWVPATVSTPSNVEGGNASSIPVVGLTYDGGSA